MGTDYKPYTLYSSSELDTISDSISTVLASWGKEWMASFDVSIDQIIPYCDFEDVVDVTEIHHYEAFINDEDWCAIQFMDNDSVHVGMAICGVQNENINPGFSDISKFVLHSSMKSLAQCLLQSNDSIQTFDFDTKVQDYARTPGSGCSVIVVKVGDFMFYLIMSESVYRRSIGPSKSKRIDVSGFTDPQHAIKNTQIDVEVVLGSAVLDVKSLAHLNVGDVIQIDKKISDLCDVKICGNSANIGGYLGNVGGKLSVKLASKKYTQ